MGFWDVAAGAGEAVDPALNWMTAIYKMRKNNQAGQDAETKDTLDRILGTRGAIRSAAVDQMKKGENGRRITIDTSPYQSRRDAATGAGGSDWFQKGVLGAAGEQPFDWEKKPASIEPEAVPIIGTPAPYEPGGKPQGEVAAIPQDVPRPAEVHAKTLREAQNVTARPEEEAALRANFAAIDGLPISPGAKQAYKARLMDKYAADMESRKTAQMGAASGRIYDEMHPETTADTLAQGRINQTTTRESEDRAAQIKGHQISAYPQIAKLNEEIRDKNRGLQAIKDQNEKHAATVQAFDDLMSNPDYQDPEAQKHIRESKQDYMKRYEGTALPEVPITGKALLPVMQRAMTDKTKADGKAKAPKVPDENRSISVIDARLKALEGSGFPTPGTEQEIADLKAERKAISDKKLEKMGVTVEPGVVPPKPVKPPPPPGTLSKIGDAVSGAAGSVAGGVKGMFNTPPAAPPPPPARASSAGQEVINSLARRTGKGLDWATKEALTKKLVSP